MGKIISIFNQKGGVGKTTTAINLSAGVGRKGKKVLLVDLDPQGNTTSGLGIDKNSLDNNIYDVIMGEISIKDIILETSAKNVDIIPSGIELSGIELELSEEKWQYKLKDMLDIIEETYDFIFVDCPPTLGITSLMGLIASDFVLIPIQAEFYALEGTGQLLSTLNMVRSNYNKDLVVLGVIMTMYDARTRLASDVLNEVKKVFGDLIFNTKISRNVRLAEAPSYGQSIFDYDRISKGSWDYNALSKEFLNRVKKYD